MRYIATLSIVSHGHRSLLRALLYDLERQDKIDQLLITLTLNLQDEEFDARLFPRLNLQIIKNKKPKGFGDNHNAAFLVSEGDWFLIINPDIRLPDTQSLTKILQTNRSSDILLAPLVVNSQGILEDSVRRHLTPWSLIRRARGLDREPLRPDKTSERGQTFYWVAGMFLAIKRDTFQKINGFDSRFFLYCEDYDLCARLYLSGGKIAVIKNVQVVHDAQRGSHRSRKYLWWHLSSLFKVWLSAAFWRVLWVNRAPKKLSV
jgi:N-acetylglucosaminyl-diphospho-decaprenol L-rhamnosyltransferase